MQLRCRVLIFLAHLDYGAIRLVSSCSYDNERQQHNATMPQADSVSSYSEHYEQICRPKLSC